jgi:hypothetical protein
LGCAPGNVRFVSIFLDDAEDVLDLTDGFEKVAATLVSVGHFVEVALEGRDGQAQPFQRVLQLPRSITAASPCQRLNPSPSCPTRWSCFVFASPSTLSPLKLSVACGHSRLSRSGTRRGCATCAHIWGTYTTRLLIRSADPPCRVELPTRGLWEVTEPHRDTLLPVGGESVAAEPIRGGFAFEVRVIFRGIPRERDRSLRIDTRRHLSPLSGAGVPVCEALGAVSDVDLKRERVEPSRPARIGPRAPVQAASCLRC